MQPIKRKSDNFKYVVEKQWLNNYKYSIHSDIKARLRILRVNGYLFLCFTIFNHVSVLSYP